MSNILLYYLKQYLIDIIYIVYKVGKYKISSFCFQTYPCRHYVKYNIYGTNLLLCCKSDYELLSGDEIYTMLKNDNLSHPHFDIYKEFIRKRDHPTNAEIAEKQLLEEQRRKKHGKQKNKRSQ